MSEQNIVVVEQEKREEAEEVQADWLPAAAVVPEEGEIEKEVIPEVVLTPCGWCEGGALSHADYHQRFDRATDECGGGAVGMPARQRVREYKEEAQRFKRPVIGTKFDRVIGGSVIKASVNAQAQTGSQLHGNHNRAGAPRRKKKRDFACYICHGEHPWMNCYMRGTIGEASIAELVGKRLLAHPDLSIEKGLSRKLGKVKTGIATTEILSDLRRKLSDMNVMLRQLELRITDFEQLDAADAERTLSQ
jgi:hypothetical protein